MRSTLQRQLNDSGLTILELLIASVIFASILLLLTSVFELSAKQLRSQFDYGEQSFSADAAFYQIESDLVASQIEQFADLPPLPDSVTPEQRPFFQNRLLYPIEINRTSGSSPHQARSFPNAHPKFDTIAFVTRLNHEGYDPLADSNSSHEAVVGYYVAYTHDSPLVGRGKPSMKLHRHYRPGGSLTGQAYSTGLIQHFNHQVNDEHDEALPHQVRPLGMPNRALARQGRFANQEIPFLISNIPNPNDPTQFIAAIPPWPRNPVAEALHSKPPSLNPKRGTLADWQNPNSHIHNTLFPDEALAHRVVRFEINAFREVEVSPGTFVSMDARAINRHLSFPDSDEWPALVSPSLIEITLGVIDEPIAMKLNAPRDWIVDWDNPQSHSAAHQLIRQHVRLHHLSVSLDPLPQ